MKKTLAKRFLILTLALLTLLAAAGEKKQEAAIEKPAVVTGVQTEIVKASSQSDYYEAVGTVRAKTITVLSSKVVGTVIALQAREGERVRAGQVLVEAVWIIGVLQTAPWRACACWTSSGGSG